MIKISIRQFRALLGVLVLLGAVAARTAAAAPLMTYQGRLKESGMPVSGAKSIDILLCNCLSGVCAPACASSGAQSVSVSSGLFRTTFTVPSSVDLAAGPWYLEVQIGGAPLSPREQLTYSPYAVYAATASALAANAVNTASIVSGAVDSSKLAADAVTTVKMLDGSVTTGKLAAGAVDSSKLAASALAGVVQKTGDTMTGQLTNTSTITVQGNAFSVGGSALVVTSGNVGIGTTSPATMLDVNGAHQFGAGATKSTFTATGNLQMVSGSTITSNGTLSISTAASAALTGVPAIFITQSGNVGIGMAKAQVALDVNGGLRSFTNTQPFLQLLEAGSLNAMSLSLDVGGTQLNLRPGGLATSPSMTMTNTGNVGIGTTLPTAKLHVSGPSIFEGDVAITTGSAGGGAHLRAAQITPPGIVGVGACGTGSSVSIAGTSTDMHGSITINTGTAGAAAGCGATVTFNRPYAAAPKAVILSRASLDAALSGVNGDNFVTGVGPASFTVTTAVTPGLSRSMTWYYVVIE